MFSLREIVKSRYLPLFGKQVCVLMSAAFIDDRVPQAQQRFDRLSKSNVERDPDGGNLDPSIMFSKVPPIGIGTDSNSQCERMLLLKGYFRTSVTAIYVIRRAAICSTMNSLQAAALSMACQERSAIKAIQHVRASEYMP